MYKLTAERARNLFSYDLETGELRWKVNKGIAKKGEIAGTMRPDGYRQSSADGRVYLTHRLIWLFVTGKFPINEIDHVNGDKTDNRFENLRDVNRVINTENQRNSVTGSKSGKLGVHWNSRSNKFIARIKVNKKSFHLGTYTSPEEAHAAYLTAKRRLHAGCTI